VPSTFRYAVSLLLSLMTTPLLRTAAITLLSRMVDHALAAGATGSAAQALGDLLWRCVSRLVACTQAEPVPPPDVMQLLDRLVVTAPLWLLPHVAALDPFPEGDAFSELRAKHEALSADAPLAERLSRFCERARGLLPGPRRTAAQALLAALRAPGSTASTLRVPSAGASLDASTVAPAIWNLARLCEDVDDDTVRELAAAALAVVGPPDPFAVAFCAPDAAASAADAPAPTVLSAVRGRAVSAPTENEALAGIALRALAGYLVDADHATVRAAMQATIALLRTDTGVGSLSTLPDLERSYLSVLAPAAPAAGAAPPAAAQPAADAGVPLDDDTLWAPPPAGPRHGAAYDAWLCRLVHALLSHATGSTLRICRPLAGRKADLAALLLPYAMEDIAAGAGAGAGGATLRQLLTDKVYTHILGNEAAGARATYALLECLAFLRDARVRAGLKGLPANPPASRVASTAASQGVTGPVAWATVHWLDLEYLCVARAALRCGACFTALQYVEYWCEENYGALTFGEADALNDAGPLQRHIVAALDSYALCAEPDGIYGMLRSPHVALQLHRAEHENAWGRALASHDAILRGAGSGFGSAAAAAEGVLRALRHLGCPFLLTTVAGKLSADGSTGVSDPAFQEAQMEAAWRAGQWNVPEPAGGQPSSADGFHSCLLGALRATHAGELAQCAGLLSRGRASVMRSVTLTGAESAASINTAVVRLQLLDEVSDVAEARWNAAAAAASGTLGDAAAEELSDRWTVRHTSHLGGRCVRARPARCRAPCILASN
jgi:hypothetical protein